MINEEIIEYLRKKNIPKDDAICYLLAVYYSLEPTYIPDLLVKKIHISEIFTIDKFGLTWNVPLFSKQETAFDWVKTEYVALFKRANTSKGGHVREATLRMKAFFALNPDVRKDEVIKATMYYISNTDINYLREPHYFIEKGSGIRKTSDLEDWVTRYREEISKSANGGKSLNTRMQ